MALAAKKRRSDLQMSLTLHSLLVSGVLCFKYYTRQKLAYCFGLWTGEQRGCRITVDAANECHWTLRLEDKHLQWQHPRGCTEVSNRTRSLLYSALDKGQRSHHIFLRCGGNARSSIQLRKAFEIICMSHESIKYWTNVLSIIKLFMITYGWKVQPLLMIINHSTNKFLYLSSIPNKLMCQSLDFQAYHLAGLSSGFRVGEVYRKVWKW